MKRELQTLMGNKNNKYGLSKFKTSMTLAGNSPSTSISQNKIPSKSSLNNRSSLTGQRDSTTTSSRTSFAHQPLPPSQFKSRKSVIGTSLDGSSGNRMERRKTTFLPLNNNLNVISSLQ